VHDGPRGARYRKLVAAVFGTVRELIALGVIAIVVIVVGAYILSRP
jgi:hypothetical protein